MGEADWLRPTMPGEPAAAFLPGRSAPFELRPLSLGEVLDRTFTLYRSRFWLFAAIAMIAASVYTVGMAISLSTIHKIAGILPNGNLPVGGPAASLGMLRAIGSTQIGVYAVMLLFALISAITQAATAMAVTEVYLQRPTSAKEALGRILPRWYRWIGIAIWQGCSAVWIPVVAMVPAVLVLVLSTRSSSIGLGILGGILAFLAVFAGVPAGIVMYLRNALAVPAAVTEGLTLRAAMRRSKVLSLGTKGRIFVVILIAAILLEIVGVLQLPARFLISMAPGQQHYLVVGLSLLLTFVGQSVVAPVALIGLTLVYFDQRVRKEALDLQLLLEGARGTAVTGLPPTWEGHATGG